MAERQRLLVGDDRERGIGTELACVRNRRTTVATLPLEQAPRRRRLPGVPISAAHSKRRSTVARRSERSSATRSSRKSADPALPPARAGRAGDRDQRQGATSDRFNLPGRRATSRSRRLAAGGADCPSARHEHAGGSCEATGVARRRGVCAAPARCAATLGSWPRSRCRNFAPPAASRSRGRACARPAGRSSPSSRRPIASGSAFRFRSTAGPGLLSMEAIADPPAYGRARAAVRYDEVASKLVHALKYGDRLDLAPMMGRWMANAGRALLAEADAIVPVPLHWRRQWARRFNQSALLAEVIAKASGRGSRTGRSSASRRPPSRSGCRQVGPRPERAGRLPRAGRTARPRWRGAGSCWSTTC